MRTVLLVAHDVAPSQALQKVAGDLAKKGVEVRTYFGFGQPIPDGGTAELMAEHVDAVICGMSSSPGWAEHEIRTAESAKQLGIPYGFYSDAFGCYQRPWFGSLRDEASFVFVLNGPEAADAYKLFPKAKAVASGNPMWEGFFIPTAPKEVVRQRLGIDEARRLVFCSGGKDQDINRSHFSAAISAVRALNADGARFSLVLGPHPGDPNFNSDPTVYDDLFTNDKESVRIASKKETTTSELVTAADVVVDVANSTVSIEAVCRRKPVINFFTDASLDRLMLTTGKRRWTLCEQGCSLEVVNSWHELAKGITLLALSVETGTWGSMRRAQVANYQSAGKPGDAVRVMAKTLEQFAARNPWRSK